MRRPFQGAGFGPALCQPFPPSSHGAASKTPGSPRTEDKRNQILDSGRNTRNKAAVSTDGRNTLLHFGSKATGKAPTVHLPWNKARIRPVDCEGRSRAGLRERKAGWGVGVFENGEAGMRESSERARASERGGGEGGLKGKSKRNGVNHAARNGERGEETFPGFLPTNRYRSLDGRGFINRSYFQTCVDTGKPPPVKQKLSEALGLITVARRPRGRARVGNKEWAEGRSRDAGERTQNMHGLVGGRSISALVSQRDVGAAGRRDGKNGESEVWWVRGKPYPNNDSETGSRASSSEFSGSVESSTNSLVTAGPEGVESGSEMEKQEWETVEEETDTESERESGLEGGSTGGSGVSGEFRNSSAQLNQESAGTNARSEAALQSSRAPHSSRESIEEEAEEDEEVRNVLSLTLASQASSSEQPGVSSGVTKDLSPIIEATEEEEEEDKGKDGKAWDLGNEPTD